MLEITFKIEDKDYVSLTQNGDKISLSNIVESPTISLEHTHIKERTYDTFMFGNTQFFRLGDTYGMITPDDTMREIGRSKYYKDRKKVSGHAVQ